MLERVREKIAHRIWEVYGDFEEEINSEDLEFADTILSTKAGNHPLKELIEMIDKGELVKLAKDQSLPDNPTSHRTRAGVDEYWLGRGDGYNWAQKDMLKPDKKRRVWVRVEPLK